MFYAGVLWMFVRNSLIREMMFPANFMIQVVTRLFWFFARVALFVVIYREVDHIQGWSQHQYFAFMSTGMLINAIVEAFFMPNCAAFCDNIRTGKLDFALTRPIDSQFLDFDAACKSGDDQSDHAGDSSADLVADQYWFSDFGDSSGLVSLLHCAGCRLLLFDDDHDGLHKHLVWAESGLVRLLVLYHHFRAIPSQHLRWHRQYADLNPVRRCNLDSRGLCRFYWSSQCPLRSLSAHWTIACLPLSPPLLRLQHCSCHVACFNGA